MAGLVAASVSLLLIAGGLHRSFPAEIDNIDKADNSAGSMTLSFLNAPKGFTGNTHVKFFDTRYVNDYGSFSSDPEADSMYPGILAGESKYSDLLQVEITSDFLEPYSKKGPMDLPWLLATTGTGKLFVFAKVRDNGKILNKGSCQGSGSNVDGRVADNAVPVRAEGPDPRKLSFGYLNQHPPTLDVKSLLAGKSVHLPDTGGSADRATYANSEVRGNATVFAGATCPGVRPRIQPSPKSSCSPRPSARPSLTLLGTDEQNAIAQALGAPAPTTEITTCSVITSIQVGGKQGRIEINAAVERNFLLEGGDGSFAARLPGITVLSVDREGNGTRLPFDVSVFQGDLLGDASKPHVQHAPEYPYSPPALSRFISATHPHTDPICKPSVANCPQGQLLQWSSPSGDDLNITYNGQFADRAAKWDHSKEAGTVEWSIGIAVLLPVLVFLLRPRVSTVEHAREKSYQS